MLHRAIPLALAVVALAGCAARPNAQPTPEGTSLLGQPLWPREFTAETRQRLDAQLDTARRAYERAPQDADSIIWLGRRLAYLERYRDAIATFSEGVEKHPTD